MTRGHIIQRSAILFSLVFFAAADIPATQPASRPAASQPAGAATGDVRKEPVDRTTATKTWDALVAAAGRGDQEAFRACCYNHNEISRLFMDAYFDTVITTHQLATAVAMLGEEGKTLSKSFEATFTDLTKMGINRRAEIDGDMLLWVQGEPTPKVVGQRTLYFRRVEGEWLLDSNRSYAMDSAEGRKVAEDFMSSTAPQLKVLKAVTLDIQAKKITTLEQMRDRLKSP